MNWTDLLMELSKGEMPNVSYNGKIGKVVLIKDNGRHKGIGVDFGKGYDDFFHEEVKSDKRSKYINELTLVK